MYYNGQEKGSDSIIKCDFKRSDYDSCVYVKEINKDASIFLLLYVDDMLISKGLLTIAKLKG